MIRRFIPQFALHLRQRLLRYVRYHVRRRDVRYARETGHCGTPRMELRQTIRRTNGFAAKTHNLRLAGRHVSTRIIGPGETFSFWRTIGAPTTKRGYRAGRNLVRGELVMSPGGGLCQLSGLLYHLGLRAGLEVIERHAHSVDIYTEETRYTPLGADATVVYGYRDLLLRNPHAFPVQFRIEQTEETITTRLCAPAPLPELAPRFVRLPDTAGRRTVELHLPGRPVARSTYRIPPEGGTATGQ